MRGTGHAAAVLHAYVFGSAREIRTHTVRVLNPLPLPLGYSAMTGPLAHVAMVRCLMMYWSRHTESNCELLVTTEELCRLTTAAWSLR